jgi:hypothetical protein
VLKLENGYCFVWRIIMQKITLEELGAFLKGQGFVFQGSEIYGGLANA